MSNNVFDKQIIALKSEITALKQAKQKAISQIKFVETTIENVEIQGINYKAFYIEPKNDVNPLISFRVHYNSSDYAHTFVQAGLSIKNDKLYFSIRNNSQSTQDNSYNITFISTSNLRITEA